MGLFRWVTGWASVLTAGFALSALPAAAQWDQPAAALAGQVANILGPGQATLSLRNFSSIANTDVPSIRAMLEQDLKSRGVSISGGESANAIRITLSQNDHERLWVAEVIQGKETRVVMTESALTPLKSTMAPTQMVLRSQRYVTATDLNRGDVPKGPVLGALEVNGNLVVIKESSVTLFQMSPTGWRELAVSEIRVHLPLSQDPRALLLPSADGSAFTAFLPGTECGGNFNLPAQPDSWTVHCRDSDDPWPILQNSDPHNPTVIKAFYNAARNYFTGVVAPSIGVDLPPFYSAAWLPRPAASALLIAGIDSKVQLVDNGISHTVSGARDWGSDFAVLNSGCGSGRQIIASGSGEAASDSLRAYELPAQEAVPASAPLAVEGTVTALWPAPDGKSVFAIVRGPEDQYEVDRVTALCN
ncbi:MAG TPA: hypothetical protein VGG85_19590 [Terracidiphilus sp.]|jgi:hypothetical protein